MNNPLWEFAVMKYAQEGVASACLRAQDEVGSDVNLLLYAAWLAEQQCELSATHLAALDAKLVPWRGRVVEPLRELRRDWRGLDDAQELRVRIKSLELRAEQIAVQVLWDCHAGGAALPVASGALRLNLERVLALTCSDQKQLEVLGTLLAVLLAD